MNKEMKLPDKASQILRVAIGDLRLVFADSRYKINMRRWHTQQRKNYPAPDQKCGVCLAGAVMAKSLNARIDFSYSNIEFLESKKLRMLDYIRSNNLISGLVEIYPKIKKEQRNEIYCRWSKFVKENFTDKNLGREYRETVRIDYDANDISGFDRLVHRLDLTAEFLEENDL